MGVVASGFDVGVDALNAVLAFVYSGCAGAPPREACVCADEDCLHLCCRPALDFALGVLFTSFKFEISELVSLYQRHLLVLLKNVVVEDILLILAVVNMCNDSNGSCKILFTECVRIVADSDLDMLTLDKALPEDVVKQVIKLRPTTSAVSIGPHRAGFPNAHMKKIYSALDSNDFELVRMLLAEGHTSLDDACALHYAVSYCHEKIVKTILDLGMADVNRRNTRGYTLLHCAAIRKEPAIIISVLAKGALPSEVTPDGRTALQILKRLTKNFDKRPNDEVKASTDDQLCIDMLEEAERKNPLLREPFVSHSVARDDLHDALLYLENRVIFAKLYFPFEAKLAMGIAGVEGTSEFVVSSSLSETQENLLRKEALSRTVALGRYFFPRCSAVLDNLLDNEGELNEPEHNTKRRYYEIIDEILDDL